MMLPVGKQRSAFTAIELSIVVSVIAMLSGMATQAVVTTLRTHAVNSAATAIEHSADIARDLAVRAHAINSIPSERDAAFTSKRYGVVLIPGNANQAPVVAVTWGASATEGTILKRDGLAIQRTELPAGVAFLVDDGTGTPSALTQTLGWCFQHGTGLTSATASTGSASAYIGDDSTVADIVNPSGITRISAPILIATPDGAIAARMAVLPSGDVRIVRD
ncbi:MAG: prepilin-type N-terminal cleavage/methylation domain-containing protein [Planctomycetota bacterium]|nr:prepilin-type N-terminal cleavage/methylation domain-containing protein [Planctomycetota bacterium]